MPLPLVYLYYTEDGKSQGTYCAERIPKLKLGMNSHFQFPNSRQSAKLLFAKGLSACLIGTNKSISNAGDGWHDLILHIDSGQDRRFSELCQCIGIYICTLYPYVFTFPFLKWVTAKATENSNYRLQIVMNLEEIFTWSWRT